MNKKIFMTLIAESITTFYDKEQDRLSLIFSGKGEKQLLGLMTPQLFRNFSPAPFLAHYTGFMPQTAEQQ